MSSSSSSVSENSKLVITAIAAATAGCAISYLTLKSSHAASEKTNKPVEGGEDKASIDRSQSTTFIYEDGTEKDTSLSNSAILFPHNHEEKMRRRMAARVCVEDDNATPRRSVTVKVPATSANCGPGYDCLGLAVDLWTEVTVERADEFSITVEGDGADQVPKDETNLMVIGLKAAYQTAGKDVPTLKYHVNNKIPFARGLGSSSAAVVAGIIAGLVLAGHRLPCWGSEALLQIAAQVEGHPDNAAPAIYGGFQLGIHNGTRWVTERIPHPSGLQLIMFIPDFIGKTSDARDVLGTTISRQEAAFNIGRLGFLIHALCSGNLDNLKWGVQDKLHQPQRAEKLYPFLYPMIQAAENAGACCAYLSGAGPTVMALTSGASGDIFTQKEKERDDSKVADAMLQVADEFGIKGKLVVTQTSYEGAKVIKCDPPFSSDFIRYRDDV